MLSVIVVLVLLSLSHGFYLNMRSNNIRKKMKKNENYYEIPKWVKKHFNKNKIPKFSEYNKRNKRYNPDNYITQEDAHYNTIQVCNLPFGLLQK